MNATYSYYTAVSFFLSLINCYYAELTVLRFRARTYFKELINVDTYLKR